MRLAPGSAPWILAPILLSGIVFLAARWTELALPAGTALLVVALGVALFFRDPDREIGDGIVSAADGRVRLVEDDRLVVFLNVHNVHVIRAPYAGTVTEVQRFSGGHLPAFLGTAKKNAGVAVTLETDWGELEVRLIAGLVARRAVAWVTPGQRVDKGQRIGIIKFGSRVDVDLPPRAVVRVSPGARVMAGTTTVAETEDA